MVYFSVLLKNERWILLKQETVSGSGINWDTRKSGVGISPWQGADLRVSLPS